MAPFVERTATAVATGRLYDAGIPAARFDEEGEIEGVVLWLDPSRLDRALVVLDDVEDEGEVYSRIVVDVRTSAGGVPAFAYHYLGPLDGRAPAGAIWRED